MDLINTGPGLVGIPEAIGSTIAFPDASPYVAGFAVQGEADLDRLAAPDPYRAGRLPLFLAAAIVLDEVGDQVPVSMTTSGPFTTATNIRGTETFLRDLHRNPALAHRLLRLATDSVIATGLIPPEFERRIEFVGNTSKTGGESFLLNRESRRVMEQLVEDVAVVELANCPAFDKVFIAALSFS
jgi:uroporphyrinogen decarboxylase